MKLPLHENKFYQAGCIVFVVLGGFALVLYVVTHGPIRPAALIVLNTGVVIGTYACLELLRSSRHKGLRLMWGLLLVPFGVVTALLFVVSLTYLYNAGWAGFIEIYFLLGVLLA
jgi:hypothetical protein